MKKIFFTVLTLILIGSFSFSQDTTSVSPDLVSKKGEPILPETGDWAIQINALPLLNYAGNMLSSAGTNTTSVSFPSNYPMSIGGKYFNSESTAFRARVMLGLNSTTVKNLVQKDNQLAPVDPNFTVEDSRKTNSNNIVFGGGIEKRKGKTSVQGLYGAEALFMFGGGKTEYIYGNNFASDNLTPTSTTDFDVFTIEPVTEREIYNKDGATFGIGVRGFIGAEYFFAPKMSLGFEYGWGLMQSSTGRGEKTTESWDSTENTLIKTNSKVAGQSSFGLNADISGGAINLTFHF